ncbi:MAG: hypothetical protein AAB425_07445 [Bdellovibrionota bacterium]
MQCFKTRLTQPESAIGNSLRDCDLSCFGRQTDSFWEDLVGATDPDNPTEDELEIMGKWRAGCLAHCYESDDRITNTLFELLPMSDWANYYTPQLVGQLSPVRGAKVDVAANRCHLPKIEEKMPNGKNVVIQNACAVTCPIDATPFCMLGFSQKYGRGNVVSSLGECGCLSHEQAKHFRTEQPPHCDKESK